MQNRKRYFKKMNEVSCRKQLGAQIDDEDAKMRIPVDRGRWEEFNQ